MARRELLSLVRSAISLRASPVNRSLLLGDMAADNCLNGSGSTGTGPVPGWLPDHAAPARDQAPEDPRDENKPVGIDGRTRERHWKVCKHISTTLVGVHAVLRSSSHNSERTRTVEGS